jgi:hypothetical protein
MRPGHNSRIKLTIEGVTVYVPDCSVPGVAEEVEAQARARRENWDTRKLK